MSVEVFPIGLLVEFVHGEGVTGKITALMIEGDTCITYKVAWWNGRSRSNEWVNADEIKASSGERAVIGFNQSPSGNCTSGHVLEAFKVARGCNRPDLNMAPLALSECQ